MFARAEYYTSQIIVDLQLQPCLPQRLAHPEPKRRYRPTFARQIPIPPMQLQSKARHFRPLELSDRLQYRNRILNPDSTSANPDPGLPPDLSDPEIAEYLLS